MPGRTDPQQGRRLIPSVSLRRFGFLAVFILSLVFSASCRKKEGLPPARIHQIARDLAASASSAAPAGTVIKIRQGASSHVPGSSDAIRIVMKSNSSDANRAAIARLLQSLNVAATRDQLTQDAPVQSGNDYQVTLRHAGVATIQIEIATRVPEIATNGGNPSVPNSTTPRLAIIIDDLGSDRSVAEAVFALGYPLTVSVLPNHEQSTEIDQEARRRGFEVMLHLPMQSVANETPEAQELRPGMAASDVTAMLDQFLQSVPDASGVNNHQGSQATADPALMDELMPALRDHRLFYVDSRTTAATVAYETAQDFGVRSAFRNVPFLDDVAEVPAVRKQLELALREARQKGQAVAIGHPHAATLEALREVLPKAQSEGIRLVHVSELVH